MYSNWDELKPTDFKRWKLMELWSSQQFIFLLNSKEPISIKEVRYSSTLDQQFNELMELIYQAEIVGILTPGSLEEGEENFVTRRYNPRILLSWASSKGLSVPEELRPLLEKPVDKLDERERTSFLKIIAALATHAGLSLETTHADAQVINEMGENRVEGMPMKCETIAKKLKEARTYLK